MKQTVTVDNIFKKFSEFRNLDKKLNERPNQRSSLTLNIPQPKLLKEQSKQHSRRHHHKESVEEADPKLKEIVSKNEIIWKIQRIKPFLEKVGNLEEQSYYSFNEGQDDLLCQVLLKQNERLCNKFIQRPKLQQNILDLRKPGCVFEVIFSFQQLLKGPPPENAPQFNKEMMQNGFVVVTQILQFYECLGDNIPVIVYKFKQLEFVRYEEDINYDYIRIKTTIKERKGWINIGFVSKKRRQIFDQMMFLAYQLTNSVPGKLFKNDILKDNFQKY